MTGAILANTDVAGQIEPERSRRVDTEMRVGFSPENDASPTSASTSVDIGLLPLRRQPTINSDDELPRSMTSSE